jgi:hypothetical protein
VHPERSLSSRDEYVPRLLVNIRAITSMKSRSLAASTTRHSDQQGRENVRRAAVLRRSGTFDDGELWRADPVLHARVSERCRLSPVHLSGIFQGSAHPAVSAGLAAEPAPGPPLHWSPGCSFRAACRGGSRRLSAGTTLVPDDGYRLLLGESGADGEGLIEPGCAQPLADLGHQIGLHLPQMRPRR